MSERRCVVCGELVAHKRRNQTTCGAQLCMRENRRRVGNANQRLRYQEKHGTRYPRDYYEPDHVARRKARDAMQEAISRGLPLTLAAEEAAVATGNTVAQVLSMWRSAA